MGFASFAVMLIVSGVFWLVSGSMWSGVYFFLFLAIVKFSLDYFIIGR